MESSEWWATAFSPPSSRLQQRPTNECASPVIWKRAASTTCTGEADVLALPALYDVWGLVVNEGPQVRAPVNTTDQVGAAADLIDSGVTGLIVPAGRRTSGARRQL